MKRRLLGVCLFVSLCGMASAQQSTAQSVPTAQVVVPRLIRFSGQLPGATGTVGITFTLHKGQQDNAALWIETQNVQLDSAGKYTVLLGVTKPEGIPTDLFSSGEAQWLGVQVQGKTEQPRVLLVSVPYALRAAEADTLAGHAPTEFVTTDKLTSAVQQQMQAASTSTTGTAVHKDSANRNSPTMDAATDFTDITTDQVVLVTQKGTGAGLIATAGNNYALSGTSTNTAIYGSSNGASHATAAALEGVTTASQGRGIFGWANTTTGVNFGLYGQANSVSGTGIAAVSTATSGATVGMEVQTNSPKGTAAVIQARGAGKIISGQSGSSNTEVFNVDGSGNVATTGFVNVGALTASGYPLTINNATAATAIYANEGTSGGYGGFFVGDGYGVLGDASGYGLYGLGGSAGTIGTSGSGFGAEGSSDSNDGVHGVSNTGTGTAGLSTSGYGVYGGSPNNYAVIGVTTSGTGVYGQVSTASQAGVIGRQMDSSANWGIFAFGNIGATGTKSSVVQVDNASRQVALYAVESPNVWFEDYGSGQLASGVASIAIDPTYAQTVNTTVEYHVFLTPNGDCDGLYVSARTPTGFEVRELHNGTSNVAFSYRIIALRRGYENQRLADVTRGTPKSETVTPRVVPATAPAGPPTLK